MPSLISRHLEPVAREALKTFPVVTIEGARQVGKSTLAALVTERMDALALTLDDPATMAAARNDPSAFVASAGRGALVIDEIQRVPELMLAIKASVDRDRRPGRFVITGSSDLLRLERTPDSLAGRAVTVRLRSLSQGEIAGRLDDFVPRLLQHEAPWRHETSLDRADLIMRIASGGYPEVQALSGRMRRLWLDAYLTRIIQRDASDVRAVTHPERLRSMLRLLAGNQAGELVKHRLADGASLPATTVTAYLDVLRTLHLVDLIAPWTPNLTQREVGRPKAVVSDSALATRLAGVNLESPAGPAQPEHLGALLEGFVATELLKQREWSQADFDVWHYRDRNGAEVDIVIELSDGSVIGLEVKASQTVKADHFKGLKFLADKLGSRFRAGAVLSLAPNAVRFGESLYGLPVAALWEL